MFKPKKQLTPLTDTVFDDLTQKSQVQEIIQKNTENVEVENTKSAQENEVIDSADSIAQTPTLPPQMEVKEVLSDEKDDEIQEQDYQGEFNEQEKEMTKEQQKEVESHYKDLELPQGMPIENVEIKENDM